MRGLEKVRDFIGELAEKVVLAVYEVCSEDEETKQPPHIAAIALFSAAFEVLHTQVINNKAYKEVHGDKTLKELVSLYVAEGALIFEKHMNLQICENCEKYEECAAVRECTKKRTIKEWN